MPAPATCPIAEVDESLSRYVKTQQEARRIRSLLSRYTASQTSSGISQGSLKHLNFECPLEQNSGRKPQELKGVRQRFARAIDAHADALARQRRLQGTLSDQREQHLHEISGQSELDQNDDVTRGHIALLRQRQRFAELQVILDCTERLLGASPVDANHDPKTIVKKSLGEQPDLPVERLEVLTQTAYAQDQIFKLKKEVVEARSQVDRASSARSRAKETSQGTNNLAQQVYALECARDELVSWVENELAKLAEESILIEDASPIKRLPIDNAVVDSASSETLIQDAYARYLDARKTSIRIHIALQKPADPSGKADSNHKPENIRSASETRTSALLTTGILAHQPVLSQLSRNERILLQQAVHLQSQISSVDEEIADSLTRLSQESHLLASGSMEPAMWGKAAGRAHTENEETVMTQLAESRLEVDNVQATVDLCSLQGKILTTSTPS